jgi:predicted membrane-bound spermidine synthase
MTARTATTATRRVGALRSNRPLLFALFFVSGFCGLLYQVVWTRLAFASFGIITPVLSVVISVFMLGLALGSWAAGRWIGTLARAIRLSPVAFYGLAELVIGIGAFVVPRLFLAGEHWLWTAGQTDSFRYLLLSALVLASSILPWCICMGATFPLMMAYVREGGERQTESFSYLYLANVLGAMIGTLLTAFVLVEAFGFRHTLWIAAAGNFSIASVSFWLAKAREASRSSETHGAPVSGEVRDEVASSSAGRMPALLWLLFSTGFISMAMEVVWVRAFAPVLKTQVYSFALVLATYLGATYAGSLLYRRHLNRSEPLSMGRLVCILCGVVWLPVLANDVRWVHASWGPGADPWSVVGLLLSISPFCAVLGYLTPSLVDQYSSGLPSAAGKAYAINVLGCILGPLAASYFLLPLISDRHALLVLGAPLLIFLLVNFRDSRAGSKQEATTFKLALGAVAAVVFAWALFFSTSYEDWLLRSPEKKAVVRRDYAASVISFVEKGETGERKHLLVNGIGMTILTPITKFMVHLPLALHKGKPQSALIICFGMGTSYRAALSWGLETTAVELIPSVPSAFAYYHTNAPDLLQDPHGKIIVDDGRRYLNRTQDKFDLIVIDPPPPVETAGSSLLYSKQFYETAKRHLKTNGILQAWFPGPIEDPAMFQAAFRSLSESFPHVRCFESIPRAGIHMLASMEPIEGNKAEDLAAHLPPEAQTDLLEWSLFLKPADCLNHVLSHEMPIEKMLDTKPGVRITDDQPYNEYFLLRRIGVLNARR